MRDVVARPVWWLPTLGFFFFLALEAGMFFAPSKLFWDPGVGRHLRTAEYILDTGRVPRADPLSFTHAGEPWLDYEWAFEATLGELNRVGGLGLVCAFCTALFGAACLGVYRNLLQSGAPMSAVVLVAGVAFLTLHLHYTARPLLFTYLFMALVVEVWQRQLQPRRRDWILLPIIFFAWANLHAGWAAAFVYLVAAMTGRALDRLRRKVSGDDAPLIPWIGLTALCLLATSFNPWGWHLHHEIYLYATAYKSFGLWDEYQAPNFSDPSMSALTILFVLGIFFAVRATRRAPVWRWEALLPVFVFLYEGLKAQRHVLLMIEVAAVPMARDLDVLLYARWWPDWRECLRNFQAQQRLARGDAWLCLVAAILMGAVFVATPISRSIDVGGNLKPDLLAFIRDHPDRFRRPLVTTWNAGPLLWDLRPGFRVSFDDRGDFYKDPTTFAYIDLYHTKPGWRDTLAKGNFDSAILDDYLPLTQNILLLPGWTQVYHDSKSTIFWRAKAELPKERSSSSKG